MPSRSLPISLAFVVALVACGGGEGTKPPPVDNSPVVTTIAVTPSATQVELGATTTLSAQVKDQNGVVMSSKVVTWSSATPSIVTVDASSGVARGVAVGTANISASVDGKSGVAFVNVQPLAVTSVAIAAPSAAVVAGTPLVLTAALKDRNGGDLAGRFVGWTSSNTRVATITNAGTLTPLSPGSTTITASSEGITNTIALVVAAPAGAAAPSITAVGPATLVPGAPATITGTGFLTTPSQNNVFVAGIAATVTAATATQLTVNVPTSVPCQSTKPVDVEITTVGGASSQKQVLRVATTRTLAVGASYMELANSGAVGCNELAANGTYIVSVFNAGRTLNANASFQLNGDAGTGALASRFPVPEAVRTVIPAPTPVRVPIDAAVAQEAHDHLEHLEEGFDLIKRLGAPKRPRSALRAASIPVPTTVGATATINFHFNACTVAASTPVTARVVYVGPKAIVLEDQASALAGKIDADMIALAREFEDVSFPLLQSFGDPLAFDAQTDKNGRIIMLFTPQVNALGANLLGFVHSCDLYLPTDDPSVNGTNTAEIYARAVTDTTASSTSLNGRPQWRRQMPSTIIHESKHIVAFAERAATPVLVTSNEAVWLEEATAQQASELYGRAIHGNSWRSNADYDGSLRCEVRPGVSGCGQGNIVMANHFLFLADFLQNIEQKTILSGADDNDIYGSSWLFTRWLTDTYGGGSEATFLQSIVKNYNVLGVDNVTAVSGKTWPELLSQFTLALAADDMPGIAAPYTIPSWNLPAVYLGYRELVSPPPAEPLALRKTNFASSFSLSVSPLRGGGAMLLKISGSGAAGTQLLNLRASGGGTLNPSSTIGIAVLRVQ
ncbi:MAG: Ig-like domain-containing protein [Gemmatimonadaceae bacterium]